MVEYLKPGQALGSFEQWCSWVRDPLLALGCKDPADRVSEAKELDGRRQQIAELYEIWWNKHGGNPVAVRDLHDEVREVIDPQGRGRQYVSARLRTLSGTRMAGCILDRQAAPGKWGVATYALVKTGGRDGHRDHRTEEDSNSGPDAPYAPYACSEDNTKSNEQQASNSPIPPVMPSPREDSEELPSAAACWRKRI